MLLLRTFCFVACVAVICAILHDAFEVMLLPRRVKNKTRIVRYFFDTTWSLCSAIGRRIHTEDKRNSFLALYGPSSLVLLLMVWAFGLMAAFAASSPA